MSVEDMRRAFMAFVAGLLGDVDRYLARDSVDPVRDGATFQLAGLWFDDAEFVALLRELGRVLVPPRLMCRGLAAPAAFWRPFCSPARRPTMTRADAGAHGWAKPEAGSS